MTMTNNYKSPFAASEKGLMNNNFVSVKNESYLKGNNENINKSFNQTRKSFNCDEYLSNLKNKLGNVTSR